MKIVVYLSGFYSLFFAVFHCGFWKMFNWNEELKKLDVLNSGVMQILNVHLIYVLLFVSFVCGVFANELRSTKLGNAFLLGCSLFWVLRIVNQFIFYNEEPMSFGLIIFLLIGAVLFALPVFMKKR